MYSWVKNNFYERAVFDITDQSALVNGKVLIHYCFSEIFQYWTKQIKSLISELF